MKNKTYILTLIFTLVLMFSIGVSAYASPQGSPEDTGNMSAASETSAAAPEVSISEEEIPTVEDITPADPEEPAESEAMQEEAEAPAARNNNTPFLSARPSPSCSLSAWPCTARQTETNNRRFTMKIIGRVLLIVIGFAGVGAGICALRRRRRA